MGFLFNIWQQRPEGAGLTECDSFNVNYITWQHCNDCIILLGAGLITQCSSDVNDVTDQRLYIDPTTDQTLSHFAVRKTSANSRLCEI